MASQEFNARIWLRSITQSRNCLFKAGQQGKLSPMGPLTAWIQNYKCILKVSGASPESIYQSIKQKEKRAESLFSVSLVGLEQLYIWKSILPSAVELVSCYSPFSYRWKLCLTVWQHHPFPKVQDTDAARRGKQELSFPYTYLLCFAPVS